MLNLSGKKTSAVAATKERGRLFVGLALILALITDVDPLYQQFGTLSTTITSTQSPSALQQLATFAAMEEVAEEEHLDWGSKGRLTVAKSGHPAKPRGAMSVDVSDDSKDGVESVITESSTTEMSDERGSSDTSSSRRRPHRRQHRKKKTSSSGMSVQSESAGVSDAVLELPTSSVHAHRIWSQLHVMEVAYSTRNNNFIAISERFTQYRQMYPIVYTCDLRYVECAAENELLLNPTTGIAASREWSCQHCGRSHEEVRESCTRCRAPSHFVKLFVGQTVKEINCAQSLIRFIHATHPDIHLHRVECHLDPSNRGKGCASLYVYRDAAEELANKLNHNVFFDARDEDPNDVIAYYVYSSQQEWLASFASLRVGASGASRLAILPKGTLVVEESLSVPAPTASSQRRRRMRQQPRLKDEGQAVEECPIIVAL